MNPVLQPRARLHEEESLRWIPFLDAWWRTAARDFVLVETLFSLLQPWLPEEFAGTGNERSRKTRFGKALGRLRDHLVGDYFVEAVRLDHRGRQEYRLHRQAHTEDFPGRTADLADLSTISRPRPFAEVADLAEVGAPTSPTFSSDPAEVAENADFPEPTLPTSAAEIADFAEVGAPTSPTFPSGPAEVAENADFPRPTLPTSAAEIADFAEVGAPTSPTFPSGPAEVAENADFPEPTLPTSVAEIADVAEVGAPTSQTSCAASADVADLISQALSDSAEVVDAMPPTSQTSDHTVPLERYEAAVLRIGWIEGQLDLTRRMLTDGGQRETALQQQLDQETRALNLALERQKQLEAELSDERQRRHHLEQRLKPWWRRLLGMT